MGRSKGERNLNIISKLFSSWFQHHNMGWPQRLGGEGGGNWLSIFVFRMRWEHLSFAMCFVLETVMLGLEPDNPAQSLECKLLESKHLILIT